MSLVESARVPITATFFRFLVSGRVWLSFFSNTIERAANLRSRARPSGRLSLSLYLRLIHIRMLE